MISSCSETKSRAMLKIKEHTIFIISAWGLIVAMVRFQVAHTARSCHLGKGRARQATIGSSKIRRMICFAGGSCLRSMTECGRTLDGLRSLETSHRFQAVHRRWW